MSRDKKKSRINYTLVFLVEIAGLMVLSFMAVAIEGEAGGVFGRSFAYGMSADFWLFLSVGVMLVLPLMVSGLDVRLLGVLLSGLLIGGVLEDFLWFVVNPAYGVSRFNPGSASWQTWSAVGPLALPTFYFVYIIAAMFVWLVLVRNAETVQRAIENVVGKKED